MAMKIISQGRFGLTLWVVNHALKSDLKTHRSIEWLLLFSQVENVSVFDVVHYIIIFRVRTLL